MGTKYSTILVGGVVQTYNDNPPSDGGAQTEANRVKYVTITDDLSAPLHSAITRMDARIVDQVNEGPTAKAGTYTTVLADHNTVIECSGTFTLSLLNPTGNAGYKVTAKNAGSGTITVNVDGGANVDGASSISLIAGAARIFYVNSGGTAYYSTSGSEASRIITTRGDIIRGDASGDPERLALDAAGTVLRSDGTDLAYATPITLDTAKSAPGDFTTTADFSGIPAWAKRVIIVFNGLSLSGTDRILVQLGTSGGLVVTGYVGSSADVSNASATATASNATGQIIRLNDAAHTFWGHQTWINVSGNIWVSSHYGAADGDSVIVGGGAIDLGGVLTQLRVTRTGTNTFDAGSVNIAYE